MNKSLRKDILFIILLSGLSILLYILFKSDAVEGFSYDDFPDITGDKEVDVEDYQKAIRNTSNMGAAACGKTLGETGKCPWWKCGGTPCPPPPPGSQNSEEVTWIHLPSTDSGGIKNCEVAGSSGKCDKCDKGYGKDYINYKSDICQKVYTCANGMPADAPRNKKDVFTYGASNTPNKTPSQENCESCDNGYTKSGDHCVLSSQATSNCTNAISEATCPDGCTWRKRWRYPNLHDWHCVKSDFVTNPGIRLSTESNKYGDTFCKRDNECNNIMAAKTILTGLGKKGKLNELENYNDNQLKGILQAMYTPHDKNNKLSTGDVSDLINVPGSPELNVDINNIKKDGLIDLILRNIPDENKLYQNQNKGLYSKNKSILDDIFLDNEMKKQEKLYEIAKRLINQGGNAKNCGIDLAFYLLRPTLPPNRPPSHLISKNVPDFPTNTCMNAKQKWIDSGGSSRNSQKNENLRDRKALNISTKDDWMSYLDQSSDLYNEMTGYW